MANSEKQSPESNIPPLPDGKLLQGQKALVTGANSGLGRGIAVSLARSGADVLINYLEGEEETREVIREIKAGGGEAIAYRADVSKEEEVQQMFAFLKEKFGTLDILLNNAGIQRDASIDDMTLEQWQQVMDVNLTGSFLCAREAVRIFKQKGVVKEVSFAAGKIICISSVHEVIPWAGRSNYTASKGGVNMFMKSLAQELAPHKIRVNSIAPGAFRTAINKDAWKTPQAYDRLMKLIPHKRIGEVEEIGRVAAWLASDQSDYITGTSLVVDGGITLYPSFAGGGG